MIGSWLSEGLSFETVIMPELLGLMIVVKVMVNKESNVACTVGALQKV